VKCLKKAKSTRRCTKEKFKTIVGMEGVNDFTSRDEGIFSSLKLRGKKEEKIA